jgi:hypothetical protein
MTISRRNLLKGALAAAVASVVPFQYGDTAVGVAQVSMDEGEYRIPNITIADYVPGQPVRWQRLER